MQSHSPMQLAINSGPRCGAHARTTGQPRRAPAIPNGRRRWHGGRAGAHRRIGRYTQTAIADRREARGVLRLRRELIDTAS
jgi:hypothetical protein